MDVKIYSTVRLIVVALLSIVIVNWLLPLLFSFIGIALPAEVVKLLDVLIVLGAGWQLWLTWK